MMSRRVLWLVFAVSGGVLAFEIGLMRVLLYASWHHFAFLIISVALLGFGASGTFLCFAGKRLAAARAEAWLFAMVLATAVTMPASLQLVRHVAVSARFAPALLAGGVFSWMLFWSILFVPFFIGATAIGFALMRAGHGVARTYASNLLGSAFGAAVITFAMEILPPAWLGAAAGVLALLGTVPLLTRPARWIGWLLSCAAVATWLATAPPSIRTDPYKYVSYVHRLEESGRADRIAAAYSARAAVEVFEGGAFHDMPFLGGTLPPPPMFSVVIDGHGAGSVLRVSTVEDAAVVDNLLMAAPYSLLPGGPRVLLLGETGGANIWLAARRGARSIDVVQPNPDVPALLRGPLAQGGGGVLATPHVTTYTEEPRHFVEQTHDEYDLIQAASMESWAVESGGVAGLNQDYLGTVEGLARCVEHLSPSGILAIGRGMQLPPRDNLKLLGTMIAALRRNGVADVDRHVVIFRDYLAACLLVRRRPWDESDVDAIRDLCRKRELTPVYFPGIRDDELNRPDRLPGPTGAPGDWLHHGTTQLLSSNADAFIHDWAFDIRPATDDRPFFANFLKLRSVPLLQRAFGDLWLTRTEVSLLFVMLSIVLVCAAGSVLTIAPLALVPHIRKSGILRTTAVYFAAIGLGYLMLEMTFLSRLVRIIGDPVRAGAVTISGFLFFSGLGSACAQRLRPQSRLLPAIVAGIIAAALAESTLFGRAAQGAGALSAAGQLVVALLFIAPSAFLMGFPMPTALAALHHTTPGLIPWAWGVNGFASVLAPPLATAIAMTHGFPMAGASALICYACAALVFPRLRRD